MRNSFEPTGRLVDSGIAINEAITTIRALAQSIEPTGSIDSERGDFEQIIQRVMAGTVSPAEGVQAANALIASRQDYH